MFCRSIMVVCMSRVLRVRAFIRWCVYWVWVWVDMEGGRLFGLSCEGCSNGLGSVGVGVVGGVGSGGSGYVPLGGTVGIDLSVVFLGLSVSGEGFQSLHWKMFSWLVVGLCASVLRVLLRGWV